MVGIFLLIVIGGFIALVTQGFRLGQPYIKMEYCNGQPRYYVWIRRFMGYDDLAGSYSTEQQARDLVARVTSLPPETV